MDRITETLLPGDLVSESHDLQEGFIDTKVIPVKTWSRGSTLASSTDFTSPKQFALDSFSASQLGDMQNYFCIQEEDVEEAGLAVIEENAKSADKPIKPFDFTEESVLKDLPGYSKRDIMEEDFDDFVEEDEAYLDDEADEPLRESIQGYNEDFFDFDDGECNGDAEDLVGADDIDVDGVDNKAEGTQDISIMELANQAAITSIEEISKEEGSISANNMQSILAEYTEMMSLIKSDDRKSTDSSRKAAASGSGRVRAVSRSPIKALSTYSPPAYPSSGFAQLKNSSSIDRRTFRENARDSKSEIYDDESFEEEEYGSKFRGDEYNDDGCESENTNDIGCGDDEDEGDNYKDAWDCDDEDVNTKQFFLKTAAARAAMAAARLGGGGVSDIVPISVASPRRGGGNGAGSVGFALRKDAVVISSHSRTGAAGDSHKEDDEEDQQQAFFTAKISRGPVLTEAVSSNRDRNISINEAAAAARMAEARGWDDSAHRPGDEVLFEMRLTRMDQQRQRAAATKKQQAKILRKKRKMVGAKKAQTQEASTRADRRHRELLASLQEKRKKAEEEALAEATKEEERRAKFKEALVAKYLRARMQEMREAEEARDIYPATQTRSATGSRGPTSAAAERANSHYDVAAWESAPTAAGSPQEDTETERQRLEEGARIRRKFKEQHRQILQALMDKKREEERRAREEAELAQARREKRRLKILAQAAKRAADAIALAQAAAAAAVAAVSATDGQGSKEKEKLTKKPKVARVVSENKIIESQRDSHEVEQYLVIEASSSARYGDDHSDATGDLPSPPEYPTDTSTHVPPPAVVAGSALAAVRSRSQSNLLSSLRGGGDSGDELIASLSARTTAAGNALSKIGGKARTAVSKFPSNGMLGTAAVFQGAHEAMTEEEKENVQRLNEADLAAKRQAAKAQQVKVAAHLAALAEQKKREEIELKKKEERIKRRVLILSERVRQEAVERKFMFAEDKARYRPPPTGPVSTPAVPPTKHAAPTKEKPSANKENTVMPSYAHPKATTSATAGTNADKEAKPKVTTVINAGAVEALVNRLAATSVTDAGEAGIGSFVGVPVRDFADWKKKNGVPPDAKVFCMTGWYPCVKQALLDRGWYFNPESSSPFFDLKWTLRSIDVEQSTLQPHQLTNHFLKNVAITTKVGLLKSLRSLVWLADVDVDEILPRGYDLANPQEMQAFIDDFRALEAEAILLSVYQQATGLSQPEDDIVVQAENECDPDITTIAATPRLISSAPAAKTTTTGSNGREKNDKLNVNAAVFGACCRILEGIVRPSDDACLDPPPQWSPETTEDYEPTLSALDWEVISTVSVTGIGILPFDPPESVDAFLLDGSDRRSGGAGVSGTMKQQKEKRRKQRDDRTARDAAIDEAQVMRKLSHEDVSRMHHLLLKIRRLRGPQQALSGRGSTKRCNMWIVKPAAKSRGRGICTFNDLPKLLKYIDAGAGSCLSTQWIVQKYMENPLLIANKKFDLRQWVLVTCWNPLTVYFYDEFYARLGVEDYDTQDSAMGNQFVHLVNNSIVKNSENFDKVLTTEDGTQVEGFMLSHAEFSKFIQFKTGEDLVTSKIQARMKDIAKWSLMCASEMVEHRKNSWELYGFDFMVDEDYNAWLIEINSSPACDYSTKVTERYIQKALVELLSVVLDYREWENSPKKSRGDKPNTGGWENIYKGPLLEMTVGSLAVDLTVKGTGVKPRRAAGSVPMQQPQIAFDGDIGYVTTSPYVSGGKKGMSGFVPVPPSRLPAPTAASQQAAERAPGPTARPLRSRLGAPTPTQVMIPKQLQREEGGGENETYNEGYGLGLSKAGGASSAHATATPRDVVFDDSDSDIGDADDGVTRGTEWEEDMRQRGGGNRRSRSKSREIRREGESISRAAVAEKASIRRARLGVSGAQALTGASSGWNQEPKSAAIPVKVFSVEF